MSGMKAIIIDDEKHVRDVIRMLAQWDRFGIEEVFEARDGEEAKQLIESQRPEIIFTDMNMPNLDGIGLLEWLGRHAGGSKTIVISAYDDFHYMRNAILYGSFDYMLKPIEPDVLNDTLERAVVEWKRDAESRRSALESVRVANEAKPLYWDRLLSGLLQRAPAPDVAEKLEREFGVRHGVDTLTIWLMTVRPLACIRFDGNVEQAFAAMLPVCNDVLQRAGIAFRHVARHDELVILLWQGVEKNALAKRLVAAVRQKLGIKALLAAGRDAKQAVDAYESARTMLMKSNLATAFDRQPPVDAEEAEARHASQLLDYAQDLKWALQSGSAENMDRLLDTIFEAVRKSGGMTLDRLNNWESQHALLQANCLQEYEISDGAGLYSGQAYWDEDGAFSFPKFCEEKRKQFRELIRKLYDVRFKKEKNIMQEIAQYLRDNCRREVGLQEIADRFYLSREYISRKFKTEFGLTITDFVTQVRIEKAKELLENPHLKIYEIADAVGYQNDKYFIKVFKRAEGVTPSEYRTRPHRGGTGFRS